MKMTINSVALDPLSKAKPISPFIYGSFIEHIGNCIHNGLWCYKKPNVPLVQDVPLLKGGVRKDLLEAVKKLKLPILRAFGGCYADIYHWKDAIGPKNSRKKVQNLHWGVGTFGTMEGLGPDIENQFGTDEFLTLCEEIGAEPYLNVNYGSGTPEEAAEWVEYCNGPMDTEYGRLRADHGRKEPYNVKIWGIANEIYASWEKGYEEDPQDYAKKYVRFAKKMREKDSSLKLIAVGYDNSEWNQEVLKIIGEKWVDYLSIHRYLPRTSGASGGQKRRLNEKIYHSIMASTPLIRDYVLDTWNDITKVLGRDTHVRISFDEWGLWYLMKDVISTNYNLMDGIWTSLVLMIFQQMSDICPIANWAQLVNSIGIIQTDPDGLILTPIYLAFKLFRDHTYGNVLDGVAVECETFSNKKLASIPKRENVPYIACNATINGAGDKIAIILANTHFDRSLDISLKIDSVKIDKEGSRVTLTSENAFDFNTIGNRTKIQLTEKKVRNLSEEMSLQLDPHSVNVLKLSILRE